MSRANLLRALASLFRETKAAATNDTAIRERVLAELGKESWASLGLINVIVHGGIVELWGSITDYRARQAMVVAAENVPGVKEVRDHFIFVEPVSGMSVLPEEATAAPAQAW